MSGPNEHPNNQFVRPAQHDAAGASAKKQLNDLVDAIEDQQRRIGSELHDNLCQNLAGIAALSAALERKLTAEQSDAAQAGLREITQLLNGAVGDARDIARGLFSADLDTSDLATELNQLCIDISHRFRVECTAHVPANTRRLPADVELHLLRIAQEAVSNAILHGQARCIDIDVTQTRDETQMTILDDGIGISGEDVADGVGLRSMAYRARLIDAVLVVRERSRGGTEVRCTVTARPS